MPGIGDDIFLHGRIWSARSYMYGATAFVPEVGPVACTERWLLPPDDVLMDPDAVEFVEYRCVIAR